MGAEFDVDAGRAGDTTHSEEMSAMTEREERELDESVYPVSPRQRAQYDATESIVELFGQFDQSSGPDGSHYVAESPFAADGLVCSSCVFYEGPRACEVVAGDIDPAGVCKLWVIPADLVAEATPEVPMDADRAEFVRTEAGVEFPDREERQVSGLELRTDEETGLPVLEGYATIYEYRYDIGGGPDNGGFTETVARGAAAKSAAEADVRLLANHEGLPLARTKSGTLQLESDDIGLKVRATLDPANPAAAEVRSAMERGDVDQMSFAFKVLRDSWDAGYDNRTISEVKLFDVSLVTYPANPATVVKLRSDDVPKSESAAAAKPAGRSVDLAKRQLEAELGRKRV
jgi:hypothetical protein